jgi:hypothetical protein
MTYLKFDQIYIILTGDAGFDPDFKILKIQFHNRENRSDS